MVSILFCLDFEVGASEGHLLRVKIWSSGSAGKPCSLYELALVGWVNQRHPGLASSPVNSELAEAPKELLV